jgi:hypothetical protein
MLYANPAYITTIPEDKQLSLFGTKHQFILVLQSPERDKIFKELKLQHGSTFAFHGSPIDNWHSILHHGLINASNTKLQLNGTAHGAGIYVSPSAIFSASYSNRSPAGFSSSISSKENKSPYTNQTIPERFSCIAITEIINKDIKKATPDIWVVPKEEYICTRFLLLYDTQTPIPNINTGMIAPSLRKVIEFCNI